MNNLLDLLNQNGCRLQKVANTHGGEYAGACPFCGGKDRFRVWNESDRYWCRQCGKHGDAIQFVRETRNIGYREACDYLGIVNKNCNMEKRILLEKMKFPKGWEPRESIPPADKWQEKARLFLNYTQKNLRSDSCADVREWLHTARGLSDNTVRDAQLGFNIKDFYYDRDLWGLDPQINEKTDKYKKLWLPAGLVIPCFFGEKIVRLRIRTGKKEQPYHFVSGGDSRCMILEKDKAVCIVVESELDALLINQEAGDLVNTIALGNAQIRPDTETHELLWKAEMILCSLDYDPAGGKESQLWWKKVYSKSFERWTPAKAKDPGEMYQKGEYPIRIWVEAGLTLRKSKNEQEFRIRPERSDSVNNNLTVTGESDMSDKTTEKAAFGIIDLIPVDKSYDGVRCLGHVCPSVKYNQSSGSPVLWCGYENKGVFYIPECPLKKWKRERPTG